MAQMTSYPLVICKNQKTGSDTRYTRASEPVFFALVYSKHASDMFAVNAHFNAHWKILTLTAR